MSRIDDLSERRRRLNSQPWDGWTSDREARMNRLAKELQEAYEQKRDQARTTELSRPKRKRARGNG